MSPTRPLQFLPLLGLVLLWGCVVGGVDDHHDEALFAADRDVDVVDVLLDDAHSNIPEQAGALIFFDQPEVTVRAGEPVLVQVESATRDDHVTGEEAELNAYDLPAGARYWREAGLLKWLTTDEDIGSYEIAFELVEDAQVVERRSLLVVVLPVIGLVEDGF